MFPTGRPLTITCDPVSLEGLSSTGFIRTSGSSRQACACTTCARPISRPSAVTKEFSAMFCDLNGATATPSWKRIRHIAAVSTLLPAFEQVPWNISERARFTRRGGRGTPRARAGPPRAGHSPHRT